MIGCPVLMFPTAWCVSKEFQVEENWKRVLSNLPACVEHWATFGLSVYGRTSMINSSLISKLWFLALHVPTSETMKDNIVKFVKLISTLDETRKSQRCPYIKGLYR